ncbi:unnamed protein product [Rhodiola kirilowii]
MNICGQKLSNQTNTDSYKTQPNNSVSSTTTHCEKKERVIELKGKQVSRETYA